MKDLPLGKEPRTQAALGFAYTPGEDVIIMIKLKN